MAEFRLGRLKFNWTGEWQPDRAYVLDDIISFRGNTYVCVVNHTSTATQEQWEDTDLNSDPPKWELYVPGVKNAGSWVPNSFYAKNDLVRYGGNIYICKDNHTSPSDESLFYSTNFNGYWDLFLNGNENKGLWQQNTWYKVNDLVKYGNNIYLCNLGHNSGVSFDITKFSVYLEAVKFEDSWTDSVEYQPGDIVLFGGYSYTAKTININKQPNTYVNTDWEVISVGFDAKGSYDPTTIYIPGDVVRYGGNTFVKLLTSTAGIDPDEAGDGSLKWGLISEGLAYKGDWDDQTTYQKNDVVTLASSTYVSIAYNNSNRNPGTNDADGYWSVVARGDEESTITVRGDLLYRGTATNARLPIGDPGQILYATENGIPGWGNAKTRKVYFVNLDGIDDFSEGYGGSIGRAFRTVKYASQIAAQEGCDEQNPATIYVKAGVYDEECPITVPPYCSIVGDDSRGTIIEPAPGVSKIQKIVLPSDCLLSPGDTLTVNTTGGFTRTARVLHFADTDATEVGTQYKRMVYVETIAGGPILVSDTFLNGTDLQTAPELSITSVTSLDNTKSTLFFLAEGVMLKDVVFNNPDPDAGFVAPDTSGLTDEAEIDALAADITKCVIGFAFWRINPSLVPQVIIKSPYIYSCAAYSHKGVGAIVDGSINEGKQHPSHFASGHQSLLFGNLTQFHEGGCAIWCKDNGNSEIVSCFTYYAHIGYASSGGARMRSLGGNNSWGEYGCSARGFDPTEIPLEATIRGTELNFFNAATTASGTTISQPGKVNGDFQIGSVISNESNTNETSITGIVANGTTAVVSFATKPFNPFVVGKKITIAGTTNSALNGTFTVTNSTTSTVTFTSTQIETLGAGGTVRPSAAKARVLYVLAGNDYTKILIEPITGFIGDGQRCTQITGSNPNDPAPASPASGTTVIPSTDFQDEGVGAANRATRGAKFAVINLSEKPKITSAVTFDGDSLNFVIQEIEYYSDGPSATFKTLDVTRTVSLQNTSVTVPIAKTGSWTNQTTVQAEEHVGGTDVTLYSLLSGEQNQTLIDNPGDLLTSSGGSINTFLTQGTASAGTATYTISGNTATHPTVVVNNVSGGIAPYTQIDDPNTVWVLSIEKDNGSYTVTVIDGGEGFEPTDTITIPGDLLGGAASTNDLTVTILSTKKNLNVLGPEKITAALSTYNTGSTTLYLLVGNELMLPQTVVDTEFNSYVVVVRGQEGTIPQEHADQDSPNYPVNATVRMVVKYTPVTTLRQDVANLSPTLAYSTLSGNGGLPVFAFTDEEGNVLKTIVENDYIKIDNEFFRVDLKTLTNPGTSILTFFPVKLIPQDSGDVLQIRYRYSQIRLTGHDMLEIGTGGIATTNFPDEPIVRPKESRETNFIAPARIYYVTTNQDGNFKVGQFFKIDQATGRSTIDASAFDLSGLSTLQFALADGTQVGVEVNKFDDDPGLGGTESSDSSVPTQNAVKTYVDNNFLAVNEDVTIGNEFLDRNLTVTGNTTVEGDLTISGNLLVDGTTTTINTSELTIEDVNIILASGNEDDSLAQGAGITIKGNTDKTIAYTGTGLTGRFNVSEHLVLSPGKYIASKPAADDGSGALSAEEIMIDTNVNGSNSVGLVFPTINELKIGEASTSLTIGSNASDGGSTSVRNQLILRPGSASLYPLRVDPTGSTLLSSPQQGAFEYDQGGLYFTPTSQSGRGLILTSHMVRAATAVSYASTTTQRRNCFASTNDVFALRNNTVYRFRGVYYVSKSSTTSMSFNIGFTFSNAPQSFRYQSIGTTAPASTSFYMQTSTSTGVVSVTASTTSNSVIPVTFEGIFRTNATTGGTFTPTFGKSSGTSVTLTMNTESFLELQVLGNNTNPTNIAGTWT